MSSVARLEIVRHGHATEIFRGRQRYVQGESVYDRFMKYVMHEPNTGCWLWIGNADPNGYGKFTLRKGVYKRATRMSCELHGKVIPPEMYALHSCDTPQCVNPDHLRAGTQKQNIADMDRRGRRGTRAMETYLRGDAHPSRTNPERVPRGEASGQSKLTGAQAVEVFLARRGGARTLDLASKYGISKSAVNAIAFGRAWVHLTGAL